MAPDTGKNMGDTNYVQGKQRDDGNNNYVQQPAINDPHLYDETLNIVQFTIFSIVGRDANRNPSQVAKRVKELVLQILLKHEIFDSLCANANFSSTTMQSDFMAVSENIFNDGHINWGRIISLLAFGVKVSQYFRARRIENIDDVVVELTTHFLVKELGPWIRVNGGWAVFLVRKWRIYMF
ncbi:bcl-2-related protein A1-like isoform X2 [Xenia sp. Carnegie-2017]|uniref:bcl-2-related protein A1-like isoform X2 n=1 Tax=Xenia sp. Carnegie-2017 TaxID=2897299 RepID=UPI001F03A0EC|nr:bcl-2-related protein A1-like isoform X2 [Xenia sp. Carnegie-2017]